MAPQVTVRTYLGVLTILLAAVAVYALYVVWNYLLSPGPSSLPFYQTYMTLAVVSTFTLAAILVLYKTYTAAKTR